MAQCWSSATAYDNFPKSADFACNIIITIYLLYLIDGDTAVGADGDVDYIDNSRRLHVFTP